MWLGVLHVVDILLFGAGCCVPCLPLGNKYHEQPMCEEREDCTFMKQSHRCLGKGETLSCEEYTVKAECEGTEHCEFWTNPADNMHM